MSLNEPQFWSTIRAQALGKTEIPLFPSAFDRFNEMIGLPLHPETLKPIGIPDYQVEYFDAIQQYHKIILNKSRKIGATETALRTILYNIMLGHYADHGIMIVAGNKQTIANKFIKRMNNIMKIHHKGFTDLRGVDWNYNDLVVSSTSSHIEFFNGAVVEAFPANDSVRGLENTICIFMSEVAFIDLIDDSVVYNAVKPNLANITNADFILESTPNGRRGFWYSEGQQAMKGKNEYKYIEQPYTVALGILLSKLFIEGEKKNTKIDFEQEYCCKFTTKSGAAFPDGTIKYGEEEEPFVEY